MIWDSMTLVGSLFEGWGDRIPAILVDMFLGLATLVVFGLRYTENAKLAVDVG